jgi:hypothetical protein
MADPNVGVILSTTLKKYRKTLTDNIHKSNAVWLKLKQDGAIKEEDGGERIVEPLMYGKNTTSGSYDGYEQLDTTPQSGIDSAEFNWKQYSVSISISGKEERQNAGTSRIINLLEAKIKQAELSLMESLSEGLFSDGTGNSSKDLTGFAAMISSSGTYGGINSATYTWWAANADDTSEALDLVDMRTYFNNASIGGRDMPNLIVTSQTLFESYEGLFTHVAVTGSNSRAGDFSTMSAGQKQMADGGFQTLGFKGVPIVWDEQCPSDRMYFLNTRHMKLVVHKDANFETTDFVKPENQDARVAQILFMGNVTCNRRKSFSLLDGRT